MSSSRRDGELEIALARSRSSSVGLAHGGDDDDDLVAGGFGLHDALGNDPDSVDVGNGRPAVLLNDDRAHGAQDTPRGGSGWGPAGGCAQNLPIADP